MPRRSRCSAATSSPPATSAIRRSSPICWPASSRSAGGRARGRSPLRRLDAEVWVLARVASAVLGTIGVWLLYLAGARLFDRRTGLIASAVMAVAFLAVFYRSSRSTTRRRWSASASRCGAAPASCATGAAATTRSRAWGSGSRRRPSTRAGSSPCRCSPRRARACGDGGRRLVVAVWLPLAGLLALAAFIAANPYAVADFHTFINEHRAPVERERRGQRQARPDPRQRHRLLPLVADLGRRLDAGDRRRSSARSRSAVATAGVDRGARPGAVAYLVFMGLRGPLLRALADAGGPARLPARRLRGDRRWPSSPRAARGRSRRRSSPSAPPALCVQGAVYSVHSGIVNSRPDTRGVARAWLVAHVPPAHADRGRADRRRGRLGARWRRLDAFPALLTHARKHGTLYVLAGKPVSLEDYERTLSPALIGSTCATATAAS